MHDKSTTRLLQKSNLFQLQKNILFIYVRSRSFSFNGIFILEEEVDLDTCLVFIFLWNYTWRTVVRKRYIKTIFYVYRLKEKQFCSYRFGFFFFTLNSLNFDFVIKLFWIFGFSLLNYSLYKCRISVLIFYSSGSRSFKFGSNKNHLLIYILYTRHSNTVHNTILYTEFKLKKLKVGEP